MNNTDREYYQGADQGMRVLVGFILASIIAVGGIFAFMHLTAPSQMPTSAVIDLYGEGHDLDGDHYMNVNGEGQVFDCDDLNHEIYPGAADNSCDGVDQNCDGVDCDAGTNLPKQ